jgi:hypothetical protein
MYKTNINSKAETDEEVEEAEDDSTAAEDRDEVKSPVTTTEITTGVAVITNRTFRGRSGYQDHRARPY